MWSYNFIVFVDLVTQLLLQNTLCLIGFTTPNHSPFKLINCCLLAFMLSKHKLEFLKIPKPENKYNLSVIHYSLFCFQHAIFMFLYECTLCQIWISYTHEKMIKFTCFTVTESVHDIFAYIHHSFPIQSYTSMETSRITVWVLYQLYGFHNKVLSFLILFVYHMFWPLNRTQKTVN